MKISEMNTEQLASVLADLADPISDIANDEGTLEALNRISAGKNVLTQLGAFVKEIAPLLLRTHFDATCTIIAVLTEKKPEEVRKQKGIQTLADAYGIVDRDLIDFFKSYVHTEQKK